MMVVWCAAGWDGVGSFRCAVRCLMPLARCCITNVSRISTTFDNNLSIYKYMFDPNRDNMCAVNRLHNNRRRDDKTPAWLLAARLAQMLKANPGIVLWYLLIRSEHEHTHMIHIMRARTLAASGGANFRRGVYPPIKTRIMWLCANEREIRRRTAVTWPSAMAMWRHIADEHIAASKSRIKFHTRKLTQLEQVLYSIHKSSALLATSAENGRTQHCYLEIQHSAIE